MRARYTSAGLTPHQQVVDRCWYPIFSLPLHFCCCFGLKIERLAAICWMDCVCKCNRFFLAWMILIMFVFINWENDLNTRICRVCTILTQLMYPVAYSCVFTSARNYHSHKERETMKERGRERERERKRKRKREEKWKRKTERESERERDRKETLEWGKERQRGKEKEKEGETERLCTSERNAERERERLRESRKQREKDWDREREIEGWIEVGTQLRRSKCFQSLIYINTWKRVKWVTFTRLYRPFKKGFTLISKTFGYEIVT